MNILAELRRRFATAIATLAPDSAEFVELVLPSQDAKFGDYQANCAMPLGKKLGVPPRQIAERLIAVLEVTDLCEPPEIAGPGFINLRLRDEWLLEKLKAASADVARHGIEVTPASRTFVVDYSSPNVAKPMHVGHIRSTVIGDALGKVLKFLGHKVISDNHIGDWGTQFGMIIYGYKHFVDEPALAQSPVPELSRLYKLVNRLIEHEDQRDNQLPALRSKLAEQIERPQALAATPATGDEKADKQQAKKVRQAEAAVSETRTELAELEAKLAAFDADAALTALAKAHQQVGAAALEETAKLHAGDAENVALWRRFLPACLEEIDETYKMLGVSFDHALGESFYHDQLAGVVEKLQAKGIAVEDGGAVCVFLEGYDAPFIVRKKDGAFLYATTDLATIDYRLREWQPDAILYVVDHRQSLHFEQLFATARKLGQGDIELVHVSFGTVLGEDGKPYKTRSGVAVGLKGLLDEAVERAYEIAAKSPQITTEVERRTAARKIGIGAIKYADLAHNRTSDYVFSYDKMLAMNGNTAAYMQYSNARVKSIFARGEVDVAALRTSGAKLQFSAPAERALGLALLQFTEALARVTGDYRPNHLTAYLFELASRYSEFFEQCPVLKAEDAALRDSRLLLCDLTARTIEQGLALLGIETVERM